MPRSPLSNALAVEDLAQGDMSHTLAALQPLSAVNALMDFADEQQQERWLPALASETFVGAAVASMNPVPPSNRRCRPQQPVKKAMVIR